MGNPNENDAKIVIYDDGLKFSPFGELAGGKEDKANKILLIDDESTDEQYPSAKAVYGLVESMSVGGIFCGNVDETTAHLPSTRPDGSALDDGDFLKVSKDASLPFTVDGLEFGTLKDQAVYLGGEWALNANAFQNTDETPVKNKTLESYTETANKQSAINQEVAAYIKNIRAVVMVDTLPTTDIKQDVIYDLQEKDGVYEKGAYYYNDDLNWHQITQENFLTVKADTDITVDNILVPKLSKSNVEDINTAVRKGNVVYVLEHSEKRIYIISCVDTTDSNLPQITVNYDNVTTVVYTLNTDDTVSVKVNKFNLDNAYSRLEDIEPYFFEIWYDKLDDDYAKEYFESKSPTLFGGCTSIYKDGILGRNYDWEYNETAEFAVHTTAKDGRYATVGMTAGLTDLTDTAVRNRGYNELYKIVPFMMLDGINSEGVMVSTNVTPNEHGDNAHISPTSTVTAEICTLMLPRFVLDRFATAQNAVEYLQQHVKLFHPTKLTDMDYDQHFVIADKEKAYMLEFNNGAYVVSEMTDYPYMTNFYLSDVTFNADGSVYTPETQDATHDAVSANNITEHGQGLERWNKVNSVYPTISSEENMKDLLDTLKYTNAYLSSATVSDPYWYTEFTGELVHVNSPVADFATKTAEADELYSNRSRDPESDYYGTWQTVHSSVYNAESLTLSVKVQEGNAEHSFSLSHGIKIDDVTINYNTDNELQVKDEAISNAKIDPLLKAAEITDTPVDTKLATEKAVYDALPHYIEIDAETGTLTEEQWDLLTSNDINNINLAISSTNTKIFRYVSTYGSYRYYSYVNENSDELSDVKIISINSATYEYETRTLPTSKGNIVIDYKAKTEYTEKEIKDIYNNYKDVVISYPSPVIGVNVSLYYFAKIEEENSTTFAFISTTHLSVTYIATIRIKNTDGVLTVTSVHIEMDKPKTKVIETYFPEDESLSGTAMYQNDVNAEFAEAIKFIKTKTDVSDIVNCYDRGTDTTKTDITHYDTTKLTENDIIKVLKDETHNNQLSYFKFNGTTFSYIGSEQSADVDGITIDRNSLQQLEVKNGAITNNKVNPLLKSTEIPEDIEDAVDTKLTTEKAVKTELDKKVDISQGAENKGKILKVKDDGELDLSEEKGTIAINYKEEISEYTEQEISDIYSKYQDVVILYPYSSNKYYSAYFLTKQIDGDTTRFLFETPYVGAATILVGFDIINSDGTLTITNILHEAMLIPEVDGSTIVRPSSGKIRVADGGISFSKLNSEAISTEIPGDVEEASDTKLTTEKAVCEAVNDMSTGKTIFVTREMVDNETPIPDEDYEDLIRGNIGSIIYDGDNTNLAYSHDETYNDAECRMYTGTFPMQYQIVAYTIWVKKASPHTVYGGDSTRKLLGRVNDVTVDGDPVLADGVAEIDLSGKEDKSNKVTSISSTSTDTQYPSAKIVNTELEKKAPKFEEINLNGTSGTLSSENLNKIKTNPYTTILKNGDYKYRYNYQSSTNIYFQKAITTSNSFINITISTGAWEATNTVLASSELATQTTKGLMSGSDKTKLDNIDMTEKEDKINKVTSISSGSTDTQYPSAKAVYTSLDSVKNGFAQFITLGNDSSGTLTTEQLNILKANEHNGIFSGSYYYRPYQGAVSSSVRYYSYFASGYEYRYNVNMTTGTYTKGSYISSLITGVKGNSESSYRTGNVNITAANIGLGNVVNTGDSATPVSGGTTKFTTGGAYTELSKKIDTAGTGLSKSGTTLNHSNSITAQTSGIGSSTSYISGLKYDSQGHITAVSTGTMYPPTTAGTSNQYWRSDGSGQGAWTTPTATPSSGSSTLFTAGGAYTELNKKENTSNKITTISSGATDTQYPSAKSVFNFLTAQEYTGFTASSYVTNATHIHVYKILNMVIVSINCVLATLPQTVSKPVLITGLPTALNRYSGTMADVTDRKSYGIQILENTDQLVIDKGDQAAISSRWWNGFIMYPCKE